MGEWIGAVDGGGTKTRTVLLSADGQLVELPEENGCNPQDNQGWAETLERVMTRIINQEPEISSITMGMPGFGEVAHLGAAVRKKITGHFGARAQIINDVEMAFHGAFPLRDGILLLAGTGSMAVARGPVGLVRVGGWGDVFGDEGSAYWIGRSALSLASREIDGRIPLSGFAEALCARLELDITVDPFALMNWVSTQEHRRSAIAAVAQHVDVLAETGDVAALSLISDAAELLAEHISAAGKRAGLPEGAPWSCVGSTFNSSRLKRGVETAARRASVAAALPPLGGGIFLAAQRAGWPCDEPFIFKLADQLAQSPSKRKNQ